MFIADATAMQSFIMLQTLSDFHMGIWCWHPLYFADKGGADTRDRAVLEATVIHLREGVAGVSPMEVAGASLMEVAGANLMEVAGVSRMVVAGDSRMVVEAGVKVVPTVNGTSPVSQKPTWSIWQELLQLEQW